VRTARGSASGIYIIPLIAGCDRSLLELHRRDLAQFARAVHALIFAWSPVRVAAAMPDEEQPHEKEEAHEA
jgi:hypothetical protein